jgi:hypothetical protein
MPSSPHSTTQPLFTLARLCPYDEELVDDSAPAVDALSVQMALYALDYSPDCI